MERNRNEPLIALGKEVGESLGRLAKSTLEGAISYLVASVHLGVSFTRGSLGELLTPKNDDRVKRRSKNTSERVLDGVAHVTSRTKDCLLSGFAEMQHTWDRHLSGHEKASFTKGTAALAIVGTGVILSSSLSKADQPIEPPSWPHPERRGIDLDLVRDPKTAPIENFKDPQRALFLTVGPESAMDFVRTYGRDPKFRFTDTRAPIWAGTFKPSENKSIQIIFVDINQVTTDELKNTLSQDNQRFQAIFYRGHTYEMKDLVKFGAHFEDKFCFTMMGGCNSEEFIKDFHTPETPTAGVNAIGYWARNNYWGILTLQGLSRSEITSWGSLEDYIHQRSRMAQEELLMPGTERYRNTIMPPVSDSSNL